jgi:hypothetical protein
MARSVTIPIPEAELAERYRAGEGVAALARVCGCCPATVAKRLRALGVALRPTRYRPIDILRDEFERLYVHELLPLREIAARLGISHSGVGSKRREFGIPARSNRGRRPKAVEQRMRQAARQPLWVKLRGLE